MRLRLGGGSRGTGVQRGVGVPVPQGRTYTYTHSAANPGAPPVLSGRRGPPRAPMEDREALRKQFADMLSSMDAATKEKLQKAMPEKLVPDGQGGWVLRQEELTVESMMMLSNMAKHEFRTTLRTEYFKHCWCRYGTWKHVSAAAPRKRGGRLTKDAGVQLDRRGRSRHGDREAYEPAR